MNLYPATHHFILMLCDNIPTMIMLPHRMKMSKKNTNVKLLTRDTESEYKLKAAIFIIKCKIISFAKSMSAIGNQDYIHLHVECIIS